MSIAKTVFSNKKSTLLLGLLTCGLFIVSKSSGLNNRMEILNCSSGHSIFIIMIIMIIEFCD